MVRIPSSQNGIQVFISPMTKYVLNSGGTSDKPELARRFFSELFRDLGETPKLLQCYFAQPREDWESKYRQDIEIVPTLIPQGVRPIFEMAFPDTFAQQIARSDVINIRGGDDYLLQYWLRQFDLPKLFAGKTVGTSSASSHALAKQFWTCDWRKCMDGIGVLPIKFLAHYKSAYGQGDPRGSIDWDRAYDELAKYGDPSLPIHALEEGQFVVIRV